MFGISPAALDQCTPAQYRAMVELCREVLEARRRG